MRVNYEIRVHGRVQGVGFRYYARSRALEFNLTGYARNLPGKIVEIVVEGENYDLDTFVDHLRIGPPLARVTNVTISESNYTGSYPGFDIR